MSKTIDNFSVEVNFQYARRTELLEQVREQYHLQEAFNVPAQALIMDLYPKLGVLEIFQGGVIFQAPWAHFSPPKSFSAQRRSPFAFHRLIPSFGSSQQEKEHETKLEMVKCKTPQQEEQKSMIKTCLGKIGELNALMRYIGGRIGQFLQG